MKTLSLILATLLVAPQGLSAALTRRQVATLRYNFPYMEQGRRTPDSAQILTATVAAAVATACRLRPDLRLIAGGKSMGGRMTSIAVAQRRGDLVGVEGIAFVGFPLHPPGKPSEMNWVQSHGFAKTVPVPDLTKGNIRQTVSCRLGREGVRLIP